MNSSTSSSRTELKVVACLLVLVAVFELLTRLSAGYLSKDIQHIQQIPQLASSCASGKQPRILFLGNSATRNGVDVEVLQTWLARKKSPHVSSITKIIPDGTSLAEWQYLLQTWFARRNMSPDIVVIGFCYNSHLSDNRTPDSKKLAADFCSLTDAPQLFDDGVKSFEDRCAFGLSHLSMIYKRQEHIRSRILALVVPHFQEGELRVNGIIQKKEVKASSSPQPNEYKRLRDVLKLLDSMHCKAVLVAMPQSKPWDVDPVIAEITVKAGHQFLDARKVPQLTSHEFIDAIHMTSEGAKIYTSFLAEKLFADSSILAWTDSSKLPQPERH